MDRQGNWAKFKEWLLPSNTFKASATPQKDLSCGRLLVAIFYFGLAVAMIFTLVRLIKSGRVEVIRTGFKVDEVEAPSVALCPFFEKTSLIVPASARPSVIVEKLDEQGVHFLKTEPNMCVYDRDCVCVDLSKVVLRDTTQQVDRLGGSMQVFRERIMVTTTLMDSSPDHSLKIGLYDSVDPAPNWFYVNQGHYSIGQLEKETWTVTDMTPQSVIETFRGDWGALARQRDIYRYISQEVGHRAAGRKYNESTIIYEMKNFFVDETVSSKKAFSVYTLCFLLFLVAARSWAVEAFFGAVMPEWTPPKDDVTVRELRPMARMFWNYFCCCCGDREDGAGEQRALRV